MTDPFVPPVLPRRPRADYVNAPKAIARRTTAGRRGWFAGWPDKCTPGSSRTELAITRPQDGRVFRPEVDKRLAELFTLFLNASQEFGYPLIGAMEENANGRKQGGVSSFFCRAIKGSNPPQPSNHSSATALDLYSRSNVMLYAERPVPFVSTIHPHQVELAAAADIYWGGWYWDNDHNYVDAMHFEYMKRPADVAASLASLKAKRQEIHDRLNPPPPPEDPDVTPQEVKELQMVINQRGHMPPLAVDGDYGPLTRAAVLNLNTLVDTQIEMAETAASAATKEDAITAVQAIPVKEEV